ncbi:hypothetical protein LMG24076_05184 [Trinickia soli]|nr:hypothetical protein LMG24076_05184 [Trinickia soli]
MSSVKRPRAMPPHKHVPRKGVAGQPGNRPRGAPQAAVGALMAFFVIGAFTLVELYGCLANFLGFEFSNGFLLVEIAVATAFLLSVLIGIGGGKLWAVKLVRWSTYAFTTAYPAILVGSIVLYGKTPSGSALAWVFFGLAIVQIPAFFVMYSAFARIRWLDPKSLPSEWEPPSSFVDPARTAPLPKRGFFGWLFTCVVIFAILIRYYTGILRMEWLGVWLSSHDRWKELGAIGALLAPVLVLTFCFATRRAAFWRRRIGG